MPIVLDFLTHVHALLATVPWSQILAAAGLVIGLSLFKKIGNIQADASYRLWPFFFIKVNGEQLMHLFSVIGALLTAALTYLPNVKSQDPVVIAIQTAIIYFTSQPLYFLLYKPLSKAFMSEVNKAAALNLAKSAAAPMAGLPVPGTEDFSQ